MPDRCTNPHNDTGDADGHCYHATHALAVSPPITVSMCCHCGKEKREQYPMTGGGTHTHGKFAALTLTTPPTGAP